MSDRTWFQQKLEKFTDDPEYLTEKKLLDFTEAVVREMSIQGTTRTVLSERLGVSKAMVTKLLRGNPNMTLRTMVSISHALNCELNLDMHPMGTRSIHFYVCEDKKYIEPVKELHLRESDLVLENLNATAA